MNLITAALVALTLTAGQAEDSPGWDCRLDGNQICGPGNGVQAGQYEAGKLVPWPHMTVPAWCKDICLGS